MRTYVRVNLSRIAENYRHILAAVSPGAAIAAVVKMDAYGHGARAVAAALEAEGCSRFAVASVEEAAELRASGSKSQILVLDGPPRGEEEEAARLGILPVIHSREGALRWRDAARRLGRPLGCHLEVDTGMTRLGVGCDADEVLRLLEDAPELDVEGISTHLASAEDFSDPAACRQIENLFRLARELETRGVRPPYLHFANSAAIAYRGLGTSNMVRPGLAIYGYVNPAVGTDAASRFEVRPALEWRARILSIRDVEAGARLGYGGDFEAPSKMRVAALAVGYGDGLRRELASGGCVLLGGRPRPIVGRVSMGITLADISEGPPIPQDEEAILIGDGLDAAEMARRCGTIPYEILCGISPRVPRIQSAARAGAD